MAAAPRRTLADVLDPRCNGFNVLRLLLAASVIAWHAISVGGFDRPDAVGFFSELGVDGFFAISGFLIVRSWCRRRSTGRYLWHRALRILPGLWLCLTVTAVAATVLAAVQDRDLAAFFGQPHGPLQYVLHNALVEVRFTDIADTPADVPEPHAWNIPLWTLRWEALCYLGVVAVGWGARLLPSPNRWATVPLLAAPTVYGCWRLLERGEVGPGTRFAAMFVAGAGLYLFADRVPVSRRWLVVATVVTLPALFLLPDYQPVVSWPLAYLVVAAATLVRSPRPVVRHDLSYGLYIYGYVVQQLLAVAGLHRTGYLVFAAAGLVLTVPVAMASWFLVERPALSRKDQRLPRPVSRALARAGRTGRAAARR